MKKLAVTLTTLVVLAIIVSGFAALAVPVEVEYCGQYEGKHRILCCQDVLNSCLRQCGQDQECPGMCFEGYTECVEYEPPA